ncbi:tetraspanin-2 [Carex littledalei]|uniref:Tetraspanin-2 n=1 Tax=Carex littledalei TaxID=544730 RepID=A0A833QTC2_9POAL|nr:tetraspanin-2 [Carex littledalei]
MSLSNNITAILNFFSLLCSIPIIGAGIWLATKPDNQCLHLARWPLIILGLLILLVSLAGFVGAFWNHQCLLAIYLFAMAALIVILIIFLVFAFVVTRSNGVVEVPGRAYKEYYISGFSGWLRHYVGDGGNWERIQVCLSESSVCEKLSRGQAYFTADQFFQTQLTPLQAIITVLKYLFPCKFVNRLWIPIPVHQFRNFNLLSRYCIASCSSQWHL